MRIPKYRRNPDGRAFAEIPGSGRKRVYFGRHGDPESKRKYELWVSRLLAADGPILDADTTENASIAELVERYMRHVERMSRNPKERSSITGVMRRFYSQFARVPAKNFGPRMLVQFQDELARAGYARKTINQMVGRVKRFFKWCTQQELLPPSIYHGLATIDGVRRGQPGVKESHPVKPVPWDDVQATLPHVSPTVAALIQVQYFCGLRPGEATIMRRKDIDASGDIWIYSPAKHKNLWRGHHLVKAIPRVAQELIKPLFLADADAYLFRPEDSVRWWGTMRGADTHERKTKVYPSEIRSRERRKSERETNYGAGKLRPCYDTHSYRQAVRHGIRRARKMGENLEFWTPHQLRHGVATEISKSLGQQAAQRWLGHAKLDTTSIYAEKQLSELLDIARELDKRWAS